MRQEVLEVFDACRCMVSGNVDRIKWVNYLMYYGNYRFIDLYNKPMFWCNYFNINNVPYASPIINEITPNYSELHELAHTPNLRILEVLSDCFSEMIQVFDSLGLDGLDAFISNVGVIAGRPSIDCWGILYYTNIGKCKKDRMQAIADMLADYDSREYVKKIINEDGKEEEMACTKYIL